MKVMERRQGETYSRDVCVCVGAGVLRERGEKASEQKNEERTRCERKRRAEE